MEGISDIRITGIDERRPPRIRKEPYIDLCFRLAHKAPVDWCHDFTDHQSKVAFPSKIDIKECLYIETWVRSQDEIVGHLQTLKKAVTECRDLVPLSRYSSEHIHNQMDNNLLILGVRLRHEQRQRSKPYAIDHRFTVTEQLPVAVQKIHEQQRPDALVAVAERMILDNEIQQMRRLGFDAGIGRRTEHALFQIPENRRESCVPFLTEQRAGLTPCDQILLECGNGGPGLSCRG